MAITINGSGSITGISAGGLPDGSVTAADIESSLDLSGKTVTLPSGTGGKVLQVQSTYVGVTSASSADTNTLMGTVSITPSSTSSKILITTSMAFMLSGADTMYCSYFLHRNTTKIAGGYDGSSGNWLHGDYGGDQRDTCTITYIDSPSTTSSIDYKVYFRTTATSNKFGVNTPTYIIAMEIAG